MKITDELKTRVNPKYFELLPDFKERKIQAATSISLTLIALSLLGFFAISPTLSTIAELQRQYSDSQFVYDKLTEKLNNLAILQQKYAALEPDIPIVLSALPEKPTIPVLIGQVQELARQNAVILNHLEVFEVDLGGSEGPKKYSAFVFSIEAQGDYTDTTRFIRSLTTFQRLVTLDSISINKSVSETDPRPKMSIRAQAYFKKS